MNSGERCSAQRKTIRLNARSCSLLGSANRSAATTAKLSAANLSPRLSDTPPVAEPPFASQRPNILITCTASCVVTRRPYTLPYTTQKM